MSRLLQHIIGVSIGEPNVPRATLDSPALQEGLQILFGIAAGVAILIMAIGSLKLVASRGNPEALNQARDTIIYAIIGFVISAAAFTIVTFVVEQV